MNAIAQLSAYNTALPSLPALPTLPDDVAHAVTQFLDPEPHAGPRVRFLSEEMRARAAAFVAEMDRRSEPAPLPMVVAWLLPIAGAVRNTPAHADFNIRAGAVRIACLELPGWAFNERAQAVAISRWAWWPAAADARDLLAEQAKPILDTTRALRALAKAAPPPRPAAEPVQTDGERAAEAEHVRATVATWQAEVKARGAAEKSEQAAVRPGKPIHPDVLKAMRDADQLMQAARASRDEIAAERARTARRQEAA